MSLVKSLRPGVEILSWEIDLFFKMNIELRLDSVLQFWVVLLKQMKFMGIQTSASKNRTPSRGCFLDY